MKKGRVASRPPALFVAIFIRIAIEIEARLCFDTDSDPNSYFVAFLLSISAFSSSYSLIDCRTA